MTDTDLHLLIKELQRTSPLGRLNLAECNAVFGRLKELGHDVTASEGLAAGASEGTHPRYQAKANAWSRSLLWQAGRSLPTEIVERVDEAAAAKLMKPSEYVRRAVISALEADGIDPLTAARAE